MVEYTKAASKDYEELLSAANEAFSAGPDSGYFQKLLPKLFGPGVDTMESHYITREDGKIVSAVGAYDNTIYVCGEELKIRGIGTVFTHKDYRQKGYMKVLMNKAMDDMKRDGVDFAFLGGQRQRYEHFSFTPSGLSASFELTKSNMRYTYSADALFGYTFEPLKKEDESALDFINTLYLRKPLRAERPRNILFSILVSWSMEPLVIYKDGIYAGYLISNRDGDSIGELELDAGHDIGHVLNDYIKFSGKDRVTLWRIALCETEKIKNLSLYADSFNLMACQNMSVLRYKNTLNAFLRLKASYCALSDGILSVDIEGMERVRITVKDNKATVEDYAGAPDVSLSHFEAMHLLFGAAGALGTLGILLPAFARSWFPLPLFVGGSDGV